MTRGDAIRCLTRRRDWLQRKIDLNLYPSDRPGLSYVREEIAALDRALESLAAEAPIRPA